MTRSKRNHSRNNPAAILEFTAEAEATTAAERLRFFRRFADAEYQLRT
jgi:hypothetical protein